MSFIAKLKIKSMRILTINSWTRELALIIVRSKKRPTLKSIENEDITYQSGQTLNEIKNNGFSNILTIGDRRLNNIIDYTNNINFLSLETKKAYKINYDNPTKPSESLWYDNGDVIDCKDIKELVYDKKNLEIAEEYLGCTPKIKDVRIWWSFPQDKKEHTPLYGFHYDIDAYKFLKQFIYLTDVDKNCGPHVIIAKTHKHKNLFEKFNRRLTDKQVEKHYNKERVNVMTGKAGDGFFEDTFAYHKGTAPQKPRLILQIEYSV